MNYSTFVHINYIFNVYNIISGLSTVSAKTSMVNTVKIIWIIINNSINNKLKAKLVGIQIMYKIFNKTDKLSTDRG